MKYRAVTARLNFLARDRPELQFSVKEACRCMSAPTVAAWTRVKRIGRFLINAPRAILVFKRQPLPRVLTVWCDSDFAGCRSSRKSTSGGALVLGGHALRTYSSTQRVISLSSGEAECYAMIKGASVGLGAQSMAQDLGLQVRVELKTDSSAAKGMALKRGLGKAKHISVCYLWLQERLARKELQVHKVSTLENRADLVTKVLSRERLLELAQQLGIRFSAGRHELAPALATWMASFE